MESEIGARAAGRSVCIVLAGGLGSRLRPMVADLPKCLAPVGEKSFIQFQIELLRTLGIEEFVFSLGYLAPMVERELHALSPPLAFRAVIEQEPLGTGGAILWAMASTGIDEALVINGDTFLTGDLHGLLAPLVLRDRELARMAIVEVADRSRYGGVELDGERVVRFVEKGVAGAGPINAGVYRLSRAGFADRVPGSAFSLESSILPSLADRSQLRAVEVIGDFIDIGLPEDYLRFCALYG